MTSMTTNHEHCKCPHHFGWGILLVLLGLTFLLGNLGVLTAQVVGITWPSIIIVAGLGKLFSRRCKCC